MLQTKDGLGVFSLCLTIQDKLEGKLRGIIAMNSTHAIRRMRIAGSGGVMSIPSVAADSCAARAWQPWAPLWGRRSRSLAICPVV